jgi:glycosyltransferase involved in cell wall biosynthesis
LEAISLIIPYFENYRCLNRCVIEILKQTVVPAQIIIVDDFSKVPASSALSKKLVQELHSVYEIELLFLRNEQNMGLAASYNVAIEHCSYGNIVLMHPDIVLPTEFEIAKLVEPLQCSKVCLVGHRSVSTNDEFWSSLNVSGKLFLAASESKRAFGFNGQFDAFRKFDAVQINGFDSDKYRTAGEDGDFRLRMARRGEYVVSNAEAEHHHDFRGAMNFGGSLKKAVQYGNAQGALLFRGAKLFSAHRELIATFLLFSIFLRPVFSLAAFFLIVASISRLPILMFRRDRDLLDFVFAFFIELIRFWAHVYGYVNGVVFRKQKF